MSCADSRGGPTAEGHDSPPPPGVKHALPHPHFPAFHWVASAKVTLLTTACTVVALPGRNGACTSIVAVAFFPTSSARPFSPGFAGALWSRLRQPPTRLPR